MTHAQWSARIRKSLAVADHNPARALKSLDQLMPRLLSEAKKSVGDWHVEQTLDTISAVHAHAGDHRRSAETMLRVAEHHQKQAAYSRRGFVTACAIAAIELASAGDRRAALRALRMARPLATGLRPQEKLFRTAEKAVAAL